MFKNPFLDIGRIRRTEYALSIIIGSLVPFISFTILGGIFGNDGTVRGLPAILFLLVALASIWFIYAQGAKRCHDLGKNGFWQFIPFYGLWLLFEDGQPEENEYGQNPKNKNK